MVLEVSRTKTAITRTIRRRELRQMVPLESAYSSTTQVARYSVKPPKTGNADRLKGL